jgi:hypothetical protein
MRHESEALPMGESRGGDVPTSKGTSGLESGERSTRWEGMGGGRYECELSEDDVYDWRLSPSVKSPL